GYVFFDIFNQASAQSPILRSPDFAASQNDASCLSFWFAPFGRGGGNCPQRLPRGADSS
ncbi:hypothetical protein CEXT_609611, partial [Caerostris extrusa]